MLLVLSHAPAAIPDQKSEEYCQLIWKLLLLSVRLLCSVHVVVLIAGLLCLIAIQSNSLRSTG